jgi:hypothetical protein
MKPRFSSVIAFVLFAFSMGLAAAAPQSSERIAASFVLARGRAPTSAEMSEWNKVEAKSIADLIARHRQALQADVSQRRAVAEKASEDALGRKATDAELTTWTAEPRTYTELMKQHLAFLKEHAADYEKALNQAYQVVARRDVYPNEIAYWKARDTLPYVLLVGCVEDWAHRNSPGLMETVGTPTIAPYCRYLTTATLSPAEEDEAREAVGLISTETADARSASGRTLVAVGGDRIVGGGHVHFVAAGGEGLLP